MNTIAIISAGTLPLPPVKGGAVENLVQTFIDINEKNKDFNLTVFSISHSQARIESKNFKNTKFIFINSSSIKYKIGRVVRFILNKLVPNFTENQFIHSVLKHKKELKSVDLILIENNPYFASYLKKIIFKPIGLHLHNDYLNKDTLPMAKKILENLDFVIGVSNYIKTRVSEIAPFTCKVSMVYNGMSLERFNFNNVIKSETLKNSYGIKKGEIVIIFAGRLQETKGIKLLIEAFVEIESVHKAKLLIIGSSGFGDSKKSTFITQLEKLSLPVKDQIIFTGYVDHSIIHHIYHIADFAVFPTLGPEAFSLTTVEALASGLPVIISDSGGMPETVNSKCGIILKRGPEMRENLKKAMINLIEDKSLRERMSLESKKQSIKFNDLDYYNTLAHTLKSKL